MSEKSYPNARDCEHGWLRGKCPHCEANEDMELIEQQAETIRQLEKSNAFLKSELKQLANFNPDWDRLEAAYDSLREYMEMVKSQQHTLAKYEIALAKLRDCDWVITLPDRMDGVRQIARLALDGEYSVVADIQAEAVGGFLNWYKSSHGVAAGQVKFAVEKYINQLRQQADKG